MYLKVTLKALHWNEAEALIVSNKVMNRSVPAVADWNHISKQLNGFKATPFFFFRKIVFVSVSTEWLQVWKDYMYILEMCLV